MVTCGDRPPDRPEPLATSREIQNHIGGRGQAPRGIRASAAVVSSRLTIRPMDAQDGK